MVLDTKKLSSMELFTLVEAIHGLNETIARLTRERDEARAEVERLRGAILGTLAMTDGWHEEGCHAYGASDEDVLAGSQESPDPHCDCGALDDRKRLRSAIEAGEHDEKGER